MKTTCVSGKILVVSCLLVSLLPGCGKEESQLSDTGPVGPTTALDDAVSSGQSAGGGNTAGLPTASIPNPARSGDRESASATPGSAGSEPGSAKWIVREIMALRQQPFPFSETPEQLKAAQRQRDEKIIDMATEAIAGTHQDPKQVEIFNAAVHQLMKSRLQLALHGDEGNIDALYNEADLLHKRNPKSKAAAEAAFVRARFAHTNARRFAAQEPRWLEEFSRQAQLFASAFPQEETRALPLLYAAAWSCELHRMTEEAIRCYTLIQKKFPKSRQAKQVSAVLRRLNLKGTSLQLAGPTIDGGFVSIDDFSGKVVLVVFWASGTKPFEKQLPILTSVAAQYEKSGFSVIGVNLDEEELDVDAFLEQHAVSWPNIFHADRKKRRWNNPIVKYYGIRDIPMIWLVDRSGVVVDLHVDPDTLEARVRALLNQAVPKGKP